MTSPTTGIPEALTQARARDVARRQQRVHQALAEMRADGAEVNISSVAARAKVHRSFIHRHPDLHAAVLAAAAEVLLDPSPASTAISHRSALAENANLHAQNRRLAQHVRELEDRLSELLGQHAFERSGLGAETNTAALHATIEQLQQANLELKRQLDEREEDLAAARETNRRLMAQLNRTWPQDPSLPGRPLTVQP
ncbi:MAG TPA: hypothetical protein VE196_07445 [Pseudonocardiaceae bacterium]|jgi:chromosome segregation ATPase|nr:hypothetical protein [Pseudonocardiaceae bacterium]